MRTLKLLLLWVARGLGLFSLARRCNRRKLRILCYHGMALDDQAQFRPYLYMSADLFRERMEYLARAGYRVIDLDTAVAQLHAGTLLPDSVVITVDDGWHSFYRLALPVLKEAGFPATIYVTTYYVEHPDPVFGLVVQYMFWKTRETRISLQNLSFLPDDTVDLTSPDARQALLQNILAWGDTCGSGAERVRISELLGQLLRVPYDDIIRKRMFHLMTPDELRLARDAGMAIELHTHRHCFPADDEKVASREIIQNRQVLHEIVGSEGRHFCYPSGVWSGNQWAWLDRLDVRSSTTCQAGLNASTTPRHALHRFLDGDTVHPLEFEAALCGFIELIPAFLRRRLQS